MYLCKIYHYIHIYNTDTHFVGIFVYICIYVYVFVHVCICGCMYVVRGDRGRATLTGKLYIAHDKAQTYDTQSNVRTLRNLRRPTCICRREDTRSTPPSLPFCFSSRVQLHRKHQYQRGKKSGDVYFSEGAQPGKGRVYDTADVRCS